MLEGFKYSLGHEDEIFSCAFNYEGDIIITGSKDNTCRIWVDNDFNNWNLFNYRNLF